MHISIVAEKLGTFWGIPITNSLLTTWVAMVVVIILAFVARGRLGMVPRGLQLLFETIYTFFLDLAESILERRDWAEKVVPYIMTIFLFVFFSNVIGLIPGVGSVGFYENHATEEEHETGLAVTAHTASYGGAVYAAEAAENADAKADEEHATFVPLFRAPTADLNTTLALALISMIVVQVVGFKILGFGYLKKFFDFRGPINFAVGILEIISEFAKIISFSFRLFGNVFAGEVLLAVLSMLIPYFLPIPFYGLELFVALVQAYVFSMLTLAFIKLATVSHDEHEDEHGHGKVGTVTTAAAHA